MQEPKNQKICFTLQMPMWPWNQTKDSRISNAKYAVFQRFHLKTVSENYYVLVFTVTMANPRKNEKWIPFPGCVRVQAPHRLSRGSVMQSWLYMFAKVLGTKKFTTVWLFSRLLWTPVECWQLAEVYSDIRRYKIQISNINRLGTNTAGSLHQHIYTYIIHIWRREKLLCMKKDFQQLENHGVSHVLC